MTETAKDSSKRSAKRTVYGAYSSLVNRKKAPKKPAAEPRLKPLPKEPIPRFFAHFRWERIKAYWFSKAGLKRIGKIFAACILLGIIGVGALFVYYKNQLKEIELNDLTISETVNTYLDRNGVVLWEDKGDSDYRLVVKEDEISPYVRQATVAIEDRKFYTHPGVDLSALVRAVISTVTGQGVQGGSTLTQQLIKQVYFSDEAASANRGGISRKIKELILAIELEKMYSKEQIITMYLNESPYGGRRNGIESAAQTYFGKSAKDLTLAESALLAAIPNNPGVLNPYNPYGNEALIARQHKTLDVMAEMGYITKEEAEEAKAVPILDQILPESHQYADIKAPHFVMEVRSLLEQKYGIQTMRTGGYTIKTSLDYRAQEMAQAAVAEGDKLRSTNRSDNIAMVSLDVETSQVIAMVGSIDWSTPIYGEVNATTSPLEPGSTIKPILDYAPLFSINSQYGQSGPITFGPGTRMMDENIDSIYCAGTTGPCAMTNATGRFHGNITLRESLSNSLNIGAVKALAIVGIDNAIEMAHKLGDVSYCTDSSGGLSIAIGSGCTVKMVEHANAYSTIARGGTYKDLVYILEVKDRSGKVLESWQDTAGKRVIDEQVAYELSSILSDAEARAKINFGQMSYSFGFIVPGVWTASKTGTTTTANSAVTKDSWMVSYSTAVSTVVWNGNHDGSGLASNTNQVVRRVVNNYMEDVHKKLYAEEGKWKAGDQPVRPSGLQDLTVGGTKDIWPSWYSSEKSGMSKEEVEFNSSNHKRASACTPNSLRISIEVTKTIDPITGKASYKAPDPYDYETEDDCTSGSGDVDDLVTFRDGTDGTTTLIINFDPKVLDSYKYYNLYIDGEFKRTSPLYSNTVASGITQYLSGSEKTAMLELVDEYGRSYSTSVYKIGSTSGGSTSNKDD